MLAVPRGRVIPLVSMEMPPASVKNRLGRIHVGTHRDNTRVKFGFYEGYIGIMEKKWKLLCMGNAKVNRRTCASLAKFGPFCPKTQSSH